MPATPPENLPRTCGGCSARWYGPLRSHCAACHQTMNDLAAFDRHRVAHRCVDPPRLGMRLVGGVWN